VTPEQVVGFGLIGGVMAVVIIIVVVTIKTGGKNMKPDRKYRDVEGDTWYEVELNRYSWGFNRADALERARRLGRRNGQLHTLEEVEHFFGPLETLEPERNGS
jgi:hypothetical protein